MAAALFSTIYLQSLFDGLEFLVGHSGSRGWLSEHHLGLQLPFGRHLELGRQADINEWIVVLQVHS